MAPCLCPVGLAAEGMEIGNHYADGTFGRRAGLALVQPCLGAPGGRGISGTATFAKERSGETIEYHQR